MSTMEFRKIDTLYPYQLEAGDFIRVENNIVSVVDIADTGDTWAIFYLDEFDEKEVIEIQDNGLVDLYLPE